MSADIPVQKLEVEVPIMGESITTGMLADWSVGVGDFVATDEVVAMIETDKVSVEVRSPQSGKILELFSATGDEVNVGAPLFAVDTNAIGESKTISFEAEESISPSSGTQLPAAITETKAPAPMTIPEKAPPINDRSETRVKMTRMRQRIATRLKDAQNTAAMLTTFQECDMSNLMALRNKYKDSFEKKHGVRLGFMGFFVKACSQALGEFPAVNSQIEGDEIVTYDYVDMGIAVSAPKGLMVPVIRNAETRSIAELETEIRRLAARARDNQLSLEEMEGGTFSITNGGVFGSMLSTPILNPPQAAILGMHNIVERPMAVNGEVKIRPVMYLALSYDHRLIDGQQSVSFLVRVKELLETPARMMLGV